MKCYVKVALLLALIAMVAVPAAAGLSIDFESPAYTVGDLGSQGGWNNPSGWSITNVSPLSGAQSLYIAGESWSLNRSLSGETMNNSTVFSFSVAAGSNAGSFSHITLNNTSGATYAALYLAPHPNGNRYIYTFNKTANGWDYTTLYGPGVWNTDDILDISVALDFTNRQWKLSVNNRTTPAYNLVTPWLDFAQAADTPVTTTDNAAGSIGLAGNNARFDGISITQEVLDPNVNIDFEPRKYIPGNLEGQDGWTTGGGWEVTTTNPISGTQSLSIPWGSWNCHRSISGQPMDDTTILNY